MGAAFGFGGVDLDPRGGIHCDGAGLANAVEMLLNHKDLTLEDSDTVTVALDLFRSRPALGFSDCLMLEIARKAGHLPLGTFDRDVGKAAGTQKL